MIEKLPFGSTGHQSSRIIFGAAALGDGKAERADKIIDQLLAAGVNHLDTAASYGESEPAMRSSLAAHRDKFFLATKTGIRNGADARAQLEMSLERLGVDRVDLIQLHNLVEEDDWAEAHRAGGVVEAMVAARDEGLVGNIGVTGHGLRIARMHLRSLAEFDYASVLFPLNWSLMQFRAYRADVEELLEVCARQGVAAQTIKSIARRRWPADHDGPKFSWYEPLSDRDAIAQSVRWVLGRHPSVFLNTSSDTRWLQTITDAAADAAETAPPTDAEMATLADAQGTAAIFDGDALERI